MVNVDVRLVEATGLGAAVVVQVPDLGSFTLTDDYQLCHLDACVDEMVNDDGRPYPWQWTPEYSFDGGRTWFPFAQADRVARAAADAANGARELSRKAEADAERDHTQGYNDGFMHRPQRRPESPAYGTGYARGVAAYQTATARRRTTDAATAMADTWGPS